MDTDTPFGLLVACLRRAEVLSRYAQTRDPMLCRAGLNFLQSVRRAADPFDIPDAWDQHILEALK